MGGCGFAESFAVGLGWGWKLGVADGGAIASHVDGVHDSESAAHSEDEAHEKSDDGRPVEGHDVSLLGAVARLSLRWPGFGVGLRVLVLVGGFGTLRVGVRWSFSFLGFLFVGRGGRIRDLW